jgi:molecular chaperone GrpE
MTDQGHDEGQQPANGDTAGRAPESQTDTYELLQRERASFLNYKHRVEQERAGDRDRAQGELLLRILPAIDDLDKALASRPKELKGNAWADGVALVHRRLQHALREVGLQWTGGEGEPFDPAQHEAVLYEEDPKADTRRVGAVLAPGYRLRGKLLKPAQVVVVGPSKTPSANGPLEQGEEKGSREEEKGARKASGGERHHSRR